MQALFSNSSAVADHAPSGKAALSDKDDTAAYRSDMDGRQTKTSVAIQGVRGAFHEIAARQFFGEDIDVVPALTFDELARKTALTGEADAAVMAIENSIAGSILGNYNLMHRYELRIIGEVYLPIRQNLMALPGVQIADLKEVHSHPMALAQCREFFYDYPGIRLVESEDTAQSAAFIAKNQLRDIAAIGSYLAAELYGMEIIAPAIETNRLNFTRFLAVTKGAGAIQPNANKASVHFIVPNGNEMGSLVRVLNVLVEHGSNMTKIQSVPVIGRLGEYRFFIDFINDNLEPSIEALRRATEDFELLGAYRAGEIVVWGNE